jgi:lambda repressor-like predicted transcriptional regulator
MSRTKKIFLTLGGILAVVAVVFGAWLVASPIQAVLAQEPTPTPEPGEGRLGEYQRLFLEAFASRLGVTLEKVKEAFSGAFSDALSQAVEDGALTQEQADQMQSRLTERLNQGDLPGFFGPFGHPGGPGRFGPGRHEMAGFGLSIFAEALDMSEADLMSALREGKTIAAIAEEQGVDLSTLKASVLESVKERLDQAVQDGRMTQAQADKATTWLESNFDTLVHQTLPIGPGRWEHGGFRLNLFAEALGMSEADLMSALREGKTIAAIAEEKGIDLSTLKASVLESAKAKADEMVNWFESNFDALVNQTLPMGEALPMP